MIRRVENKFARAVIGIAFAVCISLQSGNAHASMKASETASVPGVRLFGTDWIYDPSWLHKLVPEKAPSPEPSASDVAEYSELDPAGYGESDQAAEGGEVEVLQALA